jgi:hypothetical protein
VADISAIIVNWNTKDLLLESVRTAIETTVRHRLEIVVIDNGSTDGSLEAIRAQNNIRLISNNVNLGFAAANNLGIRAATGKYICLINSDVEVLDGCLDRMCDYMDEHPEIGLLGPRVLNKDLTLQRSCTELPSVRNTFTQAFMLDKILPRLKWARSRFMVDFDHATICDVEVMSGCCLFVRRSALTMVGELDQRFFIYKEDVDLCKRFADAGWKVRFYPTARIIHYGGASSSATPARFLIEMEKANREYWRKHHSGFACGTVMAVTVAYYLIRIWGWILSHILRLHDSETNKKMITRYSVCLRWLLGISTKDCVV